MAAQVRLQRWRLALAKLCGQLKLQDAIQDSASLGISKNKGWKLMEEGVPQTHTGTLRCFGGAGFFEGWNVELIKVDSGFGTFKLPIRLG